MVSVSWPRLAGICAIVATLRCGSEPIAETSATANDAGVGVGGAAGEMRHDSQVSGGSKDVAGSAGGGLAVEAGCRDDACNSMDVLADSGTCDGTCAQACAHLVATQCPTSPLPDDALETCKRECETTIGKLPAVCQCDYRRFLSCAATGPVHCPQEVCTDAGVRICLEQPRMVVGCEALRARFDACGGVCLQEPVSETGLTVAGSYEITSSGCACSPVLLAGAPAGSPCRSSEDCAQVCCGCASGPRKFTSRVCFQGKCAGAPEACESNDAGIPDRFGTKCP
jgi:hypothetical protein